MEHNVFISYSSNDVQYADLLCSFLEQAGAKVWYAPRDVVVGAYARSICDAIQSTKVFIVLLSNTAENSDHVLNEIALAHDGLKKGLYVVPVRMASAITSSNVKYYLSRQHWQDAAEPNVEEKLLRIASRILSLLSDGEVTAMPDQHIQSESTTTSSYEYSNPKNRFSFRTAVVGVDASLLNRINEMLQTGQCYLEDWENDTMSPVHMAWIRSFLPIIREIDPLGFSGSYSNEQSNSLVGDWHSARYISYSSHDIVTRKITQEQQDLVRFSNYMGIIEALREGKAQIVMRRIENPDFRETSSYRNPLLDYVYEYGLVDVEEGVKERIEQKLAEGQSYVQALMAGQLPKRGMAWIQSFHPLVQEIDKLGFSGNYSNEQTYSLVGEWHHAQYTSYSSYEEEGLGLTTTDLDKVRFGQYLGVVMGLLVGKVRVVVNKTFARGDREGFLK